MPYSKPGGLKTRRPLTRSTMQGLFLWGSILPLLSSPAAAEGSVGESDAIIVYGRAERHIGVAGAASEGSVAGADLEVRPLLRAAELLEAVPGMIATQHSGGGKANQYFLRGFNLDHGTDFAMTLDDMPMNLRTHGHGQGYLDINGLIPELVERVDYRKGPYRADAGDFSFVGMAQVTTKDRMPAFASAEYGGYGYRRFVAGGSMSTGAGDLLLIGQAKFYDGPWQLPERQRNYSGTVKYSTDAGFARIETSLSVSHIRWQPTEQIPERAVGTLITDAYGTLAPHLRGRTDRQILTVNLSGDDWRASAWVQHYDWSLFSNFTFFLDDPVNGDELRQYEKLWGYGGRLEKRFSTSRHLDITIGAEFRMDDIGQIGLDHSVEGVVDFTRSRFAVKEASGAVYSEARWRPDDRLMVLAGMRMDAYRFHVRGLVGDAWDGRVVDGIASPKIGANYRLARGFALYANYGQGFHSNDARGVTAPTDPAPGLVKGNFKELGARFERGGLVFSADYWWSRIGSELIYVGDSGAVEPSTGGKRHGYELTAFWRPRAWLALDAVWTASKGRLLDLPREANEIPGALRSAGELGLSTIFDRWNASLRIRHLGPHALTEDGTARGAPTTLVNLRAALTWRAFEFHVELLNALNSKAHDVDYFYTTRLPGEPAAGVEGYNSRVVEPRMARIGIKFQL